jgi:[ribosomal protein S5]-alanine N-acetyltransferase
MTTILETNRLIIRQFTFEDTAFVIELLNSPGWLKFIGERHVKTEEDAKNYLRNGSMKSYEEHGFGLSLVELKSDKTPIGVCGLLKRDFLANPDIGYAFLPEFYGQGYAFEAANATIIYAKETLDLPYVIAIVNPDNQLSIRVLEKIGMTFKEFFIYPGEEGKKLLFSNE